MSFDKGCLPTIRRWVTQVSGLLELPPISVRAAILQALFIVLAVSAIAWQESVSALKVFLSPVVLAAVYGGAALLVGLRAFGKERPIPVVRVARDSAIVIGALVSLSGVVLMLWRIDDISYIPRRLAVCLGGMLHGIILSEVVLAPYDRTLTDAQGTDERFRWFVFGLSGTVVIGSVLGILYVLQDALSSPRSRGFHRFTIPLDQNVAYVPGQPQLAGDTKHALQLLVPPLRSLSYTNEVILSGRVPPQADCCKLAQKRLAAVADFLGASGVEVLIDTHIKRSGFSGVTHRTEDLPKLEFAITERRPRGN